jgi:hypothetical protein
MFNGDLSTIFIIFSLFASFTLPFIFQLCIFDCLPLHVLWNILSATNQGNDMVNYIARAFAGFSTIGRGQFSD